MKEETKSPGEASATKECPQCKSIATILSPLKKIKERMAIYGCKACGYAFDSSGGAYVDTTKGLQDCFRGATLGQQALLETMKGDNLNPATRTLLLAQLLEYGTQMWFDGLKQGLLLGAIQQEKSNGKSGS